MWESHSSLQGWCDPSAKCLSNVSNVSNVLLAIRFTKDEYIENAVSTDGMQFSTKCLPCERCCFKAQVCDFVQNFSKNSLIYTLK